jgi:hypothetical protein
LRTVNMNFCWVSKMRFSSAVPGMSFLRDIVEAVYHGLA